jgi:hypothetical protein
MKAVTRRVVLPGGLPRIAAIALAMVGLAGCVVYEPPVPYFPPTPAYSAPATPAPAEQTCREYRTTATIDGKPQQIHGTACLQPDGTWQFIH